jgi:hypothetical protein
VPQYVYQMLTSRLLTMTVLVESAGINANLASDEPGDIGWHLPPPVFWKEPHQFDQAKLKGNAYLVGSPPPR